MKKWIPVKDQMPPKDRPSLILIEDGTIHVGYPSLMECYGDKSYTRWIVGGWESCCYCGGESTIGFDGRTSKIPIAWMDLPSPISKDYQASSLKPL